VSVATDWAADKAAQAAQVAIWAKAERPSLVIDGDTIATVLDSGVLQVKFERLEVARAVEFAQWLIETYSDVAVSVDPSTPIKLA
jgi:hypothetical protein